MTHGEALEFPNLFSPLQVGRRALPNRIALSATLTNYGAANRITERWIDFLVERARGGTGLVISEIIAVDPDARAQGAIVTGYDDENLPGFRRVAEQVEDAGSCLIGQLWHPGRQQLWLPGASPKGVSDQPDAYSWTVPHVMSEDEMARVGEAYVTVAERLRDCGFAGVELHGAHGYLITQILSPWSNTRTDRYGGSLENRARFVRDVAHEIRRRCGDDFIIGLKMPSDEGVSGGIDPDEACRITEHLAGTGLFDFFAYNQGNFSLSLERHVPDLYFRPGHFLAAHRKIRPFANGVPIMAIGRINRPELCERVVSEGTADLVGMSRALIADAAFANKARSGLAAEIRPSVYDNQAWGEIHLGKPLEEPHNPRLGRAGEADWQPAAAASPMRIAVIGAGPAGLEAAWVAAARGHRVTLFGASSQIGGGYRLEANLPDRAELGLMLTYYEGLLDRYRVERRLGAEVGIDAILETEPDLVVLATGALQRRPPGVIEASNALSAQQWLRAYSAGRAPDVRGAKVVVFDHDQTAATYAVVDELARSAARVILLTPRTQLARSVNYCSSVGVYRRLFAAGVELIYAAELESFDKNRLLWRNPYTGSTEEIADVGLLVYSTPRRARDELARQVTSLGRECVLIGDCMSPRNLIAAVHEGFMVGNSADQCRPAGSTPKHGIKSAG